MKSEISEAIQMLNASQLIACEFNPRKRRNPAADKELRQSIEARGIIQPIIARPRGNQFEIGAGHRRWEMAIAIDSDQAIVPVIVRPLDDEAFRDLVMIENLQRDDLHPLDEAEGYQLLMNEKQIDVEELAGLVNKKPAEIVASLQLMKLSDKSKELFEAGTIDTVFARALARLQPADQAGGLKQAKRQSGPTTSYSIHALREFIGRHVALELSHAPFRPDDAELLPAAGPCTICPKRSGANQYLFGDVREKDICFDPKCFQQKSDIQLAHVEGELDRNKVKFVRISLRYTPDRKGLLGSQQYARLQKDHKECPKTVMGVIWEKNWNEGQLGDVVRICVDEKCKLHRGRQSYRSAAEQKSPAEQTKVRIQNLTAKRDLIIRQETLNGVLANIRKDGPTFEDMALVVRSYFGRYWHDAKREYFKRKEIEPLKSQHGGKDFEKTFDTLVLPGAKSIEALQALLVDLALHFEIEGPNKKANELDRAAERHSIDVALIRRAVTKEFEPKLSKLKQGPRKAKPAAKKKLPAKKGAKKSKLAPKPKK